MKLDFTVAIDGMIGQFGQEHLSLNPDDPSILYFYDPISNCVEEYKIEGTNLFVVTETGKHLKGSIVTLNEYQEKLLKGLDKFSSYVDNATPEELEARITNSKVQDKFEDYAALENIIKNKE